MTKDEALATLCTRQSQDIIYEAIDNQANIEISQFAAYTDIYPYLREINDKLISRYIGTYKPPPHTDEKFDVVQMFIYLYKLNILPYAVKEAKRQYRVGVSHYYGRDEDYEERIMNYSNPETRVIYELTEKFAARITKEFKKHFIHTVSDTSLFTAMSAGNSLEQIAALVYPESKFDKKVEDRTRYRVNLMYFRLASYALSQGWGYGEQFGLKMLKMYPKQWKSFFGDSTTFPTKEQLLFAAHGDQNWKPPQKPVTTRTPITKSTVERTSLIDFNGKKHKKAAVAYYKDGSAYDFVNKVRKSG